MYCPVDPLFKMVKLDTRHDGYSWYQCPACESIKALEEKPIEDKTPRIKQASEYLIRKVAKRWLTF